MRCVEHTFINAMFANNAVIYVEFPVYIDPLTDMPH